MWILLSHVLEEGTPEDVAAATLFLASDEASWVKGCSLMVDGGCTCR